MQPNYLRFVLNGAQCGPDELREVFGRGWLNLDFELFDAPPHYDLEIKTLPGVTMVRGRNTAGASQSHDRSRLEDQLALSWATSAGAGSIRQRDREVTIPSIVFFDCADTVRACAQSAVEHTNIKVDRRLLLALVPDAEDRLLDPIPRDFPAARYLRRYLRTLRWDEDNGPALDHSIALHIVDLMALIVGARGDAAHVAGQRGLMAARLASIQHYVIEHLHDPNLSVSRVAHTHGVSTRTLQVAFERTGISFSAFLLSKRLELVHRRLVDQRVAHRSIAALAYECGFGDLSHFNHCFRKAFGETPSDVRRRSVQSDA